MIALQIERLSSHLPVEFDLLRTEARQEGLRFVDRLLDEWMAGKTRFCRDGEMLLAARLDGALLGVGGITSEPALQDALRMRRFYVRPSWRRFGVGRQLAQALLAPSLRAGRTVTVNAGTPLAPAFWEALGFVREERDGYTHVFRPATAMS